MKIRIEDIDGKKKYWVNDVAYDRIEDIPAQYREYFNDGNNNGIPDQFDDLMNSVNKMQGGSGVLGGLFSAIKSQTKTSSPSIKAADYSSGEERMSIAPTLLKIAAAILVVLLAAWLYPMYMGSKQPANGAQSQIVLADSIADQITESDQPVDALEIRPSDGDLVLTVDDPNEAPYHMIGIVSYKGEKILRFELPDGEMVEGTAASLQIESDIVSKTNLDARTFRADLASGGCIPGDGEIDDGKVMIGDNEFTKTKQADGGDQTLRYALEKDGRCLVFALMLHAGNPATYDPPVKEFDFDEQVAYLENILRTIKRY